MCSSRICDNVQVLMSCMMSKIGYILADSVIRIVPAVIRFCVVYGAVMKVLFFIPF